MKAKLEFKCYFCGVDMLKYNYTHYFAIYKNKEVLCCKSCHIKHIINSSKS